MSKLVKITVADACIILIYAAAFWISHWLGASLEDLFKMIPTASASALGNIITLSLALNAVLKDTAGFTIGEPEQEDWALEIPLYFDCRAANGTAIESLEAEGLDLVRVQEGQTDKEFPILIPSGTAVELRAHFVVLEGYRERMVARRRLSISCIHRAEGSKKKGVLIRGCANTFWRQ